MSLIKRGNKYSVRYVIPTAYREVLGKSQVWKTTDTGCLSEAKRREPRILADIMESVEAKYILAMQPRPDAISSSALFDDVATLIEQVRSEEIDEEAASTILGEITDLFSQQSARLGPTGYVVRHDGLTIPCDSNGHPMDVTIDNKIVVTTEADIKHRVARRVTDRKTDRIVSQANRILDSGGDTKPLSEAIKRHLADREPNINASTLERKRKALDDFKAWSGDDLVRDITKQRAAEYLDDKVKGSPGAKWNLQALSAAWNFFKRRSWVALNIWEDFGVELKGSTRGKADNGLRRPWQDEEITKLVEAIRDKKPRLEKLDLRSLLLIGLYTGARREEIAGAHIDNVDTESWSINLVEAKNQNSIRAIPIHPVIRPLVKYLKENSENDMLIPDVKKSGRDKRYGKAFDNRTTYIIRQYVSEDKGIVFHSLRNTIERCMVKAGVPLEKYEQITGHRSQYSMSFDRYAQGTDLEDLHSQIAKVSYGEAEEIAKEIIKSIVKS